MKKVVYSIRKVRNSNEKLSGLGFINDEGTLFCKCVSKNGKQYTRAFDDVDKHCFPVFGKENEYKGYVTMYYEYEGRDIDFVRSFRAKILNQTDPIAMLRKQSVQPRFSTTPQPKRQPKPIYTTPAKKPVGCFGIVAAFLIVIACIIAFLL